MPPIPARDAMIKPLCPERGRPRRLLPEAFGFTETFRTPREGAPVHVELRLGAFVLGFASIEVAKAMHGLSLDADASGPPRSEIA